MDAQMKRYCLDNGKVTEDKHGAFVTYVEAYKAIEDASGKQWAPVSDRIKELEAEVKRLEAELAKYNTGG
jgi:hypothetical protein